MRVDYDKRTLETIVFLDKMDRKQLCKAAWLTHRIKLNLGDEEGQALIDAVVLDAVDSGSEAATKPDNEDEKPPFDPDDVAPLVDDEPEPDAEDIEMVEAKPK